MCLDATELGNYWVLAHMASVAQVSPFYSLKFATGSVYIGKDIKKEKEVALKVERSGRSRSNLYHEYQIYKDLIGCPGISRAYWYGSEGPFNVMVMDRYQLSLDDMVNQATLDPHTVVSFANQMVSTCPKVENNLLRLMQLCSLEALHHRGYIHRDIKPDNFMVGVDNMIYLIDFGLAQRFRDPMTDMHIPPTTGHSLVGTIRYTSINSHIGLQQSRRDDLESFAYTLVFLLNGKLPWQGISSRRTDCGVEIRRRKVELCQQESNVIPSTLTTFLRYTRSLIFEERPDYNHVHELVQEVAT